MALAAGGDGTVNSVVTALLRLGIGTDVAFGIVLDRLLPFHDGLAVDLRLGEHDGQVVVGQRTLGVVLEGRLELGQRLLGPALPQVERAQVATRLLVAGIHGQEDGRGDALGVGLEPLGLGHAFGLDAGGLGQRMGAGRGAGGAPDADRVGGAGAAAAKLGLFAALGKLLAKLWKLVIIGVAALGAAACWSVTSIPFARIISILAGLLVISRSGRSPPSKKSRMAAASLKTSALSPSGVSAPRRPATSRRLRYRAQSRVSSRTL